MKNKKSGFPKEIFKPSKQDLIDLKNNIDKQIVEAELKLAFLKLMKLNSK